MIGRRDFVKAMSAGVAWLATGAVYSQTPAEGYQEPCVLDMQRRNERYRLDIRTDEGRNTAAWLLRDVRAGDIVGFPDIDLLRLAAWCQACMALNGNAIVLDIHSGLRTPGTNGETEGAAQKSKHLPDGFGVFYAMDVDPRGMDKESFGKMLADLKAGGVGWYPTHIHFDHRSLPAYWRHGFKRKK
jgi:uncharacterized protein YcbK (DUF882 family)